MSLYGRIVEARRSARSRSKAKVNLERRIGGCG
jgi:hypothetical protein